MRLLLFGLSIAAVSVSALADNNLFDESASQGELDAIRRRGEAAEAALIALDELQKIFLVQEMQRGDCNPAFGSEAGAKSGDPEKQLFLAQLYSEGLCFRKDETLAAQWLG